MQHYQHDTWAAPKQRYPPATPTPGHEQSVEYRANSWQPHIPYENAPSPLRADAD
jgi:hypothetical protein